VGDAIRDDIDREACHVADGLVATLAVAHHTGNLHRLGDPATIFFAVQLNREVRTNLSAPTIFKAIRLRKTAFTG
jgi:hypothetical protein